MDLSFTAQDLMSSPVRSIQSDTTIEGAERVFWRYGHSGLCVIDAQGQLVGTVSRRDIDIALRHGFSHAIARNHMSTNLQTISPDTTLPEIQALMVTYNLDRLPVLKAGQLIGIVTRTDVLRLQQLQVTCVPGSSLLTQSTQLLEGTSRTLTLLRKHLTPFFWELLTQASLQAQERGWHLYLVGGAVRDLLLRQLRESEKSPYPLPSTLTLTDIDLVVDGFYQSSGVGAGVELAKALQQLYPDARLEVHGAFQTAALFWQKDQAIGTGVDIATARTEFYPYPAANPEVEASSIRQDLYRRDFTINALALRLTPPRAGELLDFFGGLLDLQAHQIRVLHANSFIEDPTRIYRAVRFAVRLGFKIEPTTEGYIRYAVKSGIYNQTQVERREPALQTRLKNELKYILQAPYWQAALQLLAALNALRCIHPTLELDHQLTLQLRFAARCLQRFDAEHSHLHWLQMLEIIIAHLAPVARGKVAKNLQLPDDSIKRLLTLAAQAEVVESLPLCQMPSQVVQLLHRYDLPTLILIAVKSPRLIRRSIWRYVTCWAKVQPPLNGHDLKTLGYKPGPQYRQILDHLLAAKLDGVIGDRTEAETFLLSNYPQLENRAGEQGRGG